jgi:hypothetical protein
MTQHDPLYILAFDLTCVFGASLCAVLALLAPASGHPYRANHGAAAVVTITGDHPADTQVDGLYARMVTVSDMDVPTTAGPRVVPGSASIIGLNARPLQVGAESPARARDAGEFIGMGYFAGCVDDDFGRQCTGIHPTNGGVYKKLYSDGLSCNASYVCQYRAAIYEAIAAGDDRYYQLQRNWDSSRNAFVWRVWTNGSLKRTVFPQMENGVAVLGVESGSNRGGGPLNMLQQDTYDSWFHRRGDASSAPPGVSNYRVVSTAGNFLGINLRPHAPNCDFIFLGARRFRGSGRC